MSLFLAIMPEMETAGSMPESFPAYDKENPHQITANYGVRRSHRIVMLMLTPVPVQEYWDCRV
jgi:hypothetical protein